MACEVGKPCDLPNVHCGYPDCTYGSAKKDKQTETRNECKRGFDDGMEAAAKLSFDLVAGSVFRIILDRDLDFKIEDRHIVWYQEGSEVDSDETENQNDPL